MSFATKSRSVSIVTVLTVALMFMMSVLALAESVIEEGEGETTEAIEPTPEPATEEAAPEIVTEAPAPLEPDDEGKSANATFETRDVDLGNAGTPELKKKPPKAKEEDEWALRDEEDDEEDDDDDDDDDFAKNLDQSVSPTDQSGGGTCNDSDNSDSGFGFTAGDGDDSDNSNDSNCGVNGTVVVNKVVTGNPPATPEQFGFEVNWDQENGLPSDFQVAGGAQQSFPLAPGQYTIAEVLTTAQSDAGWSFSSADCVGQRSASATTKESRSIFNRACPTGTTSTSTRVRPSPVLSRTTTTRPRRSPSRKS